MFFLNTEFLIMSPPTEVPNSYPHSFALLVKLYLWNFTTLWVTIQKRMDKPNESIKPWNNTLESTVLINRTIGQICYQWLSSLITTLILVLHLFMLIKVIIRTLQSDLRPISD